MARSLVGALVPAVRNAAAQVAPPIAYERTPAVPHFGRTDGDQQMRAYHAEPVLYACVNRLATSVGQTDWRLYRRAASGDPADRVMVTSHAAVDLWNAPNPFMTGPEFREISEQHLDLTGESYWVIGVDSRSGKLPLTLWPVRPDRMTPVPNADTYLAGYVYLDPDGRRVPFPVEQVIHLRYPDPLDPYHGLGPVRALFTDIDASVAATRWNRNFFIKSAEPGGVIEVDGMLSDEDFDRLSAQWNEQHRGYANAHKVAILSQGMKWVPRAFTMRDMQFVELRKASAEMIMLAFGLSKTLLGQTEGVNRATAEAAEYVFGKYQLVPRLNRFRAVLNERLLPRYANGGRVEFDYLNPVTGNTEEEAADRDSRIAAATAAIGAGADPAATFEAFDLPELEWTALAPDPPPQLPAGELMPALEARGRPFLGRRHGPGCDGKHHPVPVRPRNAADPPDLGPDQLPDLARMQERFDEILDALMERWGPIEEGWKADLVAQVLEIAGSGSIEDLADLEVELEEAAEALADHMEEAAEDAAEQAADEVAAQGARRPEPASPDRDALAGVAVIVAGLAAGRLVASATSTAVRANSSAATAEDVADVVEEALAGLSTDVPRVQLGGALTGAQNDGRLETFARSSGAYYANEILDSNTCLAPDALVTTRGGPVYAKDVGLGDELLTHAGRWVHPSEKVVSHVEDELYRIGVGGRVLRVTADHPILVAEGGQFVWRQAQELTVGSLVIDQSTLEQDREAGVLDLGLGEAPDVVAPVDQIGGLASVDVGPQAVPVLPVGLDDESPVDEEVNDPRTDLGLRSVGDGHDLQSFADDAFDAGFGLTGGIAATGAVPLATSGGGDDTEAHAALLALHDDGRSTARLAAVGPVLHAAVAELGTASPADGGSASVPARALPGAVVVPVGVGGGDLEPDAAAGACLCGPLFPVADLGEELGVGELALDAAIRGAGPVPAGDALAADPACGRRVVGRMSLPPTLPPVSSGARSASSPPLSDARSTVRTRLVNDLSVVAVPVESIEIEPYTGLVYDFNIPADHTFWAEGILVHNCGPCRDIDGKWLGNVEDVDLVRELYPGSGFGGYIDCLGRERCRGTVSFVVRPTRTR